MSSPNPDAFNALVLEAAGIAAVQRLLPSALPEGAVEVAVLYSSLNYKDALAVTGTGKIVRAPFPFVPGIDLAGRVVRSGSAAFSPGDLVIQTGGGIGEFSWGGYSQKQRLADQTLVAMPGGLSPHGSMVLGTAGLTAMLAVTALEEHGLVPGAGEVVVTGASGGVGSFATALLARLGHTVVASTGNAAAASALAALGAHRIIHRDELGRGPARPLESARYAGAVDTLGGPTLAAILSRLNRHGSVAACGNVTGPGLDTTVFPFILRGVSILGTDSNWPSMTRRRAAWERLAQLLSQDMLDRVLTRILPLKEIPSQCALMLQGRTAGRYVVDVNA